MFQYDDLRDPKYYENVIPCSHFSRDCFLNVSDLRRIPFYRWISSQDRFYYSLYFQDEISLFERFLFTLGARYDHYDDFGDNLSFRFSVIYSLAKDFYLKLLYGEGFRAPSFRELYLKSCPVLPRYGNPHLDAEKMRAYELGLFFGKQSLEVALTLFYQRYEDLIFLVPDNFSNFVFQNSSDDASTYGLEFELRFFWGAIKNNYLSFSYSYLDHGDVQGFYPTPYHVFSLNLNQYLFPGFFVNYHLFYLSDWKYGVDSYSISDLVFHFLSPTWEFQFGIYNLFDKKYHYPDISRFYPDNYVRPGRLFEFKVVYYF